MRPSPLAALLLLPLSACSSGSTHARPTPSVATAVTPSLEPSVAPSTIALPTATSTTAPSPTKRAVETAPPPGAPACKAAALTVTDADTVVTQQSREEVYTVRTTGPDCGLTGYPAVTLKDVDGKPLSVRYTRDGSAPPPISLSKATSVSFSVTSARTGACVDAARISVVLPGTGAPLTAATAARACNGAVTISPIRRLNADS